MIILFLILKPSFSIIDNERISICKPLLMEAVNEIEIASIRYADSQDAIEYQSGNIAGIDIISIILIS